jgi:DNA polymerase
MPASNESDFHPPPVPDSRSLATLRKAAAHCRACPLWRHGTQTVFGEGPRHARFLFVGEQPGDSEDKIGRPFVGPAGRLLDRALAEAGVKRDEVFVTNAVKHFKWEPRGPRRLHKKPNAREIAACRPWLLAELEAVEPELIVCLGATAARSIFGREVRVLKMRGKIHDTPLGAKALVTIHPSALLRAPRGPEYDAAYALFVRDLKSINGRGGWRTNPARRRPAAKTL